MFQNIKTIYFLLGYDPGNVSATSKTNTKTKTHTKTNTKTKTKTKCSKDPSHAIFSKSWEFKDIRYDAYNDKDNDQEKDNDNDNDNDKDKGKDKDESAEKTHHILYFRKAGSSRIS